MPASQSVSQSSGRRRPRAREASHAAHVLRRETHRLVAVGPRIAQLPPRTVKRRRGRTAAQRGKAYTVTVHSSGRVTYLEHLGITDAIEHVMACLPSRTGARQRYAYRARAWYGYSRQPESLREIRRAPEVRDALLERLSAQTAHVLHTPVVRPGWRRAAPAARAVRQREAREPEFRVLRRAPAFTTLESELRWRSAERARRAAQILTPKLRPAYVEPHTCAGVVCVHCEAQRRERAELAWYAFESLIETRERDAQ